MGEVYLAWDDELERRSHSRCSLRASPPGRRQTRPHGRCNADYYRTGERTRRPAVFGFGQRRPDLAGKWQRDYQLVWYDREGKQTGTVDAPMRIGVGQVPHLSPDGKRVVVQRDFYLWVIDLEKGTGLRLTSTFSQNGRWLAYESDETGNYEGYVQSFSADGQLGAVTKRVSTAGGILPGWRRDGSELFFVAADGLDMSSSAKTGGTEFEFAAPKPLFKTRMLAWAINFHEFDVSPDGQRFLIGTLAGDTQTQPPTVILNWSAALNK